ncbi:hypothetical protein QD712_37740 [Streptomyces acidiscabies]|uniref:hypothetical protein n=1 Tax=Streptomyces acidiscabies TaxID=42234 RepID=UPI0030D137C2
MAIPRARKALGLGLTGAVVAGLGVMALPLGAEASVPTTVTAAADAKMPSAVEDFSYPGADRVLQERKITLKRGDGRILLADCAGTWNIKIESRLDSNGYCFRTTAKTGFLSLELPDAYGVWTEDHPVSAKLTAAGKETVVKVPADEYQPVGEAGATDLHSVLVELRVTG